MAKTSLDAVASYTSLNAGWKEVWSRSRPKSRNTVGVDEASINDFARDPKPALRLLSKQIRSAQFEFNRLRPHLVLKPNGKDRLICVPTVHDRVVQRALLDFLTAEYGARFANPISYGFIKGRTVEDAAKQACKLRSQHRWAFKTDISAFFDRVDRVYLHQRIRQTIRQKSLHGLLIAASNCEIAVPSGASKKRILNLGIKEGLGVRQGMPLSPFFANLFLEPFDRTILKKKFHAVRYADDLIFFADTEEQCKEIESFCKTTLKLLQLEIPELGPDSKSVIVPPDTAIEFLGLGLQKCSAGYELVLMQKQREAIKAELLRFGSIRDLLTRKISLAHLGPAIESRISGYLHSYDYCTNYPQLSNELDGMRQTVLRKIYGGEGLGIKLESLTHEQRIFLDLT